MKSIIEKLEENYLLGCIRFEDNYHLYLMPIAWWIINYEKYSPSILNDEKRRSEFRNGVLTVTDEKIVEFLDSIEEDKITEQNAVEIIHTIAKDFPEENYGYLNFFIDFDEKKYISGFYDIEIENYLPGDGWKGFFDMPIKYLPLQLQLIWKDSETPS